MTALHSEPHYPFEGQPETGELREVAPGIFWLRMPLPFKLDHINLWLLEDGDGWTLVDTGLGRDDVKTAWEGIIANHFTDRPLKRVICTHFHPDHMGLAGWFRERFGVDLWMTMAEWTFGRMLAKDDDDVTLHEFKTFYKKAGFDDEMMEVVAKRANPYPGRVHHPHPGSFVRIAAGDVIEIGGRRWRVMIGEGHSPEHACLVCNDPRIMISGDQILPRISPLIGVWPQEHDADPLGLYLKTLPQFKTVAADTLVLPSHNWPFTGLLDRLEALEHHHDERLEETLGICDQPRTAVEVLRGLFTRELDTHQTFFAVGESIAHLHYLMGVGKMERAMADDGAYRYVAVG